jgi:hypothetical protein
MHALSKVLDIATVQASHRDTSIGRHVHVRLLRESFRLGRGKTCETVGKVSHAAIPEVRPQQT